MKKLILLILLFLFMGLISAVAPSLTPKCHIRGVIQSIEFKEAYDEPCLTEECGRSREELGDYACCPINGELRHPARYYITITTQEATYVSGDTSEKTCEQYYPSQQTKTFIINADKVKPKDIFSQGKIIEGDIDNFYIPIFSSYQLSSDFLVNCPGELINEGKDNNGRDKIKCIKTLSNGIKAEIKIMPQTASTIAIERLGELGFNIILKEVRIGQNIKAVYELEADKEGKIIGLFKVKGKVSAQVDAETGEIFKVKKPWWAFLASEI